MSRIPESQSLPAEAAIRRCWLAGQCRGCIFPDNAGRSAVGTLRLYVVRIRNALFAAGFRFFHQPPPIIQPCSQEAAVSLECLAVREGCPGLPAPENTSLMRMGRRDAFLAVGFRFFLNHSHAAQACGEGSGSRGVIDDRWASPPVQQPGKGWGYEVQSSR